MRFRLSEANYEGVCIIKLEGHWTQGTASTAFMKLFDRESTKTIAISSLTRPKSLLWTPPHWETSSVCLLV